MLRALHALGGAGQFCCLTAWRSATEGAPGRAEAWTPSPAASPPPLWQPPRMLSSLPGRGMGGWCGDQSGKQRSSVTPGTRARILQRPPAWPSLPCPPPQEKGWGRAEDRVTPAALTLQSPDWRDIPQIRLRGLAALEDADINTWLLPHGFRKRNYHKTFIPTSFFAEQVLLTLLSMKIKTEMKAVRGPPHPALDVRLP